MDKSAGLAFLLILVIALVAWLVTMFVQPKLSEGTNFGVVFAVAAVFGAVGFLKQFKDVIVLLQILEEHKTRKLLNAQFERGPYDKATIERSTRYYIRPKCSNIDPAQEKEIRHALVATREDLFDKGRLFSGFR